MRYSTSRCPYTFGHVVYVSLSAAAAFTKWMTDPAFTAQNGLLTLLAEYRTGGSLLILHIVLLSCLKYPFSKQTKVLIKKNFTLSTFYIKLRI
jgi:hypothetical protein